MPARSDDVTHPPGTGALSGVPARSQHGVGTGDESRRCRGGLSARGRVQRSAVPPKALSGSAPPGIAPYGRAWNSLGPESLPAAGRGLRVTARPGPAELRSALQRRSLGLSVSVSGGGLRRSVGTRGRDRRTWGGVEWGRGGGVAGIRAWGGGMRSCGVPVRPCPPLLPLRFRAAEAFVLNAVRSFHPCVWFSFCRLFCAQSTNVPLPLSY